MAKAKSTQRGKSNGSAAVLFHADATDPDMLYFSRFNAVDPYLAFSADGRKYGVAPALEYGRMKDESGFDEVLLLSEIREGAIKRFKLPQGQEPDTSQLVRHIAKLYGITAFRVASRFPAGLAMDLQKAGVRIEVERNGGFFPEREFKNAAEVAALRKGNQASEAGFRAVVAALTESKIKNGRLVHRGSVLTAEKLHALIAHAALDAGATALHTIVAAGDQAVDNHCAGFGPIPAGELIVVDIFPRRPADGYWGDMTRTYLKGHANDAQKRLVRTVKRAHEMAIGMIKPGVGGGKVHNAVQSFFDKEGYETVRESRETKGFFHALGHGIGLEVHEPPIMRATSKWRLKAGHVVTIEPGLYYRGLGGTRIEDMVHVIPGGCERISRAPYKWEIP